MSERAPTEPPDRTPNVWRMWFWRVIALLAVVTLFLLLRPGGAGDGGGRELPGFSLPALFGDETWTQADLLGKPAVINFWASWCEPCREEAPMLDDFQRRYSGEIVILGVDVQDSPLAARQFAREYGLSYPLVQDLDQDLYRALRETDGLPQTYFVTADGSVVTSGAAAPALGELDEDQLEAAIQALLETDA